VHALTGCDTTSAVFGWSKVAAFSKIVSRSDTLPMTDIIAATSAFQDAVADAGLKLLVMLYGGQLSDSLNSMRYTRYMEKARLSALLPEKLPRADLNVENVRR